MKFYYIKICILFNVCISIAQQKNTYVKKIESTPQNISQFQIDSLLNTVKTTISKDSLANLYHFIGLKWGYSNWKKNKNNTYVKKAITYTEEAIKLKEHSKTIDKNSLKQSLYNLSYFKMKSSDIYGAIKTYKRIINIGEFDEAHDQLGVLYSKIGDYSNSINCINKVLEFYKGDTVNISKIIVNHIRAASTYSAMGYKANSKKIKYHLLKADSLINSNYSEKEKKKDYYINYYILRINQMEGNRLSETGNYNKAISYHKKVLNAFKPTDSLKLAIVHNSLALSLTKLKKFEASETHLKKALLLNREHSPSYENLGDIYLEKKDFNNALNYYQKAISLSANNKDLTDYKTPLTQDDLELAKEKLYLLNHLTTKANSLITFYKNDANKEHLKVALHTFLSADKLVDIIRFESTENQSKLFWREKSASLYMKAVEVCHLLNKPEDAYYFMERNKALLLLEDMTNEQAKTITQLPDSIAQREFELKQNIYLSENKLHTLSSIHKDSVSNFKDLVFSAKQHYNTFVDSLELAFPDYAKMKRKTDILPYKTLKNNYCNKDHAILQYILNDNQGYGLLSTDTKTLFFPLEHINTLNNTLISFYKLLTKNETIPNRKEQLNQLSNSIFKTLIPEYIYTAINNKKLTIVSDYTLQQIPFETLCVNTNKQHYLIEDTDIHYAYSMSYLDNKKHITTNAKRNWLGYAPINFETHHLPKLAFSKTEVTEANKLQGGDMVLNTNASKSKWLNQMPNYKVNHLSTHADIDASGNHWIAFSDDKLYLKEIYATKNQSDMVVLSACNTSTGELKKGEGVMSLARGFFYSGAKSVVSSLWFADDKSSKDIIVDFYKELDKGQTKSAALRQAKLNYINAYRDTKISPSRWGALILIGDNSPIKHHFFSTSIIIVIAILALLVISFLVFKRKRT